MAMPGASCARSCGAKEGCMVCQCCRGLLVRETFGDRGRYESLVEWVFCVQHLFEAAGLRVDL
jgi:hypothetical protein